MPNQQFSQQTMQLNDGRKLVLSSSKNLLVGVMILLIAALGIASWVWLTPLSSAAIATGVVVVETRRKTIQHLEGGIVRALYVQDGDRVEKNQLLVELSGMRAKTNLAQLKVQYFSELARVNRLQAELSGEKVINFDAELLSQTSAEVSTIIKNQNRFFIERRALLLGEKRVIKSQLQQNKSEWFGIQQRIKSGKNTDALLQEQLTMQQSLLKKGHAARARVLELQQEQSVMQGTMAELLANAETVQQRITELAQQSENLDRRFMQQAGDELQRVQQTLQEAKEAILAADDVLSRIYVRSPQSGKVVGLNVHTVGGVVAAGETLMEIVPEQDQLVVEALIRLEDIDIVSIGQKALVRLTAYSFRRTPPLNGTLVHLSADRVDDETSGVSAYLARIELDKTQLEQMKDVHLYPGMPAETMILLEQRRPIDFLLDPLRVSAYRAMREQ
ncbi:HlyD family type I secretion periplasmic adaptor subunit [Pelagibaculum spongiae]|uniref:Membrane fusion protein (MFP) family protein n=1 Tax=Pelagibaculum spongiae TaxID=2080658 RepID=A0A2V1GNS7_9GAMM|nr:HlyD family type I secretion periplasmic adaptor subunit [Pelagibaculum spongiae]PVZ63543.1 HlyD family type I secretion periplasmic adaptor subunit [Pelagibaculum spongiae]